MWDRAKCYFILLVLDNVCSMTGGGVYDSSASDRAM